MAGEEERRILRELLTEVRAHATALECSSRRSRCSMAARGRIVGGGVRRRGGDPGRLAAQARARASSLARHGCVATQVTRGSGEDPNELSETPVHRRRRVPKSSAGSGAGDRRAAAAAWRVGPNMGGKTILLKTVGLAVAACACRPARASPPRAARCGAGTNFRADSRRASSRWTRGCPRSPGSSIALRRHWPEAAGPRTAVCSRTNSVAGT